MPNPRNRHSRMRKRSRRGHDKVALPTLTTCKVTGEVHRRHHAYKHEGSLYHKGQLVVQAKAVAAAEENDGEA
jgi:large subunit ribosomal protein L32